MEGTKKTGLYSKIAERMKAQEQLALTRICLESEHPYILRLDGHKFSTFASCFNKPFDERLHQIMIHVTKDLMNYFTCAATGYTQSDEITLIFPALNTPDMKDEDRKALPYGGRILKIATLASGYCSARFSYWCMVFANDPYIFTKDNTEKYDQVILKLKSGEAHFDARIFNVDNERECLNNIKWRSNFDCVRNSKMNLARKYYSTRELHKLNASQAIEKLRTEKNIDWKSSCPASFRYGTFVKREKKTIAAKNKKTNEDVETVRVSLVEKHFGFPPEFDEELCDLLMVKFWNDVPERTMSRLLA